MAEQAIKELLSLQYISMGSLRALDENPNAEQASEWMRRQLLALMKMYVDRTMELPAVELRRLVSHCVAIYILDHVGSVEDAP